MKISCLIPTYNNFNLLVKTLENILKQTRPPDRIFVVDNNSDDNTAEIRKLFPDMEYIKLNDNEGSAGGYYAAIKAAEKVSDYLFFSDDDAEYKNDALEILEKNLTELSKKHKVGAVRCAWPLFPEQKPMVVENSGWAGMLVKIDVVRQIGLPLKELFLYAEDLEYCNRMRSNGFLIYVIPGAEYLNRYDFHKRSFDWLGGPVSVYKESFRLYYAFRNETYVNLVYNKIKLIRHLLYAFKISFFLEKSGKSAVINGIIDGFLGRLGRNDKYKIIRK